MRATFCDEDSVTVFPAGGSMSESLSEDAGLLNFDALLPESRSEPSSLVEQGSFGGAFFFLVGLSMGPGCGAAVSLPDCLEPDRRSCWGRESWCDVPRFCCSCCGAVVSLPDCVEPDRRSC